MSHPRNGEPEGSPFLHPFAFLAAFALVGLLGTLALVACHGHDDGAARAALHPPGVGQIAPAPGLGLPAAPLVAKPAPITAERKAADDADDVVATLKGQLRAAEARADTADEKADRRERAARDAGVQALVTWATAILAVVAILGTVAAVVTRSLSLAILPAACGAGIAVAQATRILLDHPIAGAVGVSLLVAAAVLLVLRKERHSNSAATAAVGVAEALKPAADVSEVAAAARRAMQSKIVAAAGPAAGKIIDRIRARIAKA